MLDIQDFSIVLTARNHNPTMVNPDFLRGSGVIPGDWELARPPVVSSQAAQIIFKNGIKIEAQPGSINFSQGIDTDSFKNIELPSLARRYAVTLPNVAYRGVGINPRRFVTFGIAQRKRISSLLKPFCLVVLGKILALRGNPDSILSA